MQRTPRAEDTGPAARTSGRAGPPGGGPSRPEPGTVVEAEPVERTALARPWKVVVHDDPVTLMDYVTMVFRRVFAYPQDKAHRLMMEVHRTGRAIVWSGAREQAEMYVMKLHGHHLLATMEPVEDA